MNIKDVARKAEQFRAKLEKAKTPQPFEWYRYDSLGNWIHIERMLTGKNRNLPKGTPVLDVGCADGDIAFFLESLGYEVTVIDYPPTNHNSMAGVRKLKEVFNSRVEILSMDVDTQFTLPKKNFGLALVLGAIYHLKNPFYVLETVSKHANNVLLSTRVAEHLPGVQGSLKDVSAAYLLGERECNGDKSNYWIFTEAGFRQMLRRTNWDVLDLKTFGDTEASDPVNAQHDERLFCYARSRYAMANVDLLQGWHTPEGQGWRWTEQHFQVGIQLPDNASRYALKMKLYVPPESLPITLSSTSGPPITYTNPGYHEAVFAINDPHLAFTLDHAIPGDPIDNRERGIVVHSLTVE